MFDRKRYDLARYHDRRRWMVEHLGGKCVKCLTTEELEIDHIEKIDKLFTLTMRWTRPLDLLEQELSKCQLLCRSCHKKKSFEAGDFGGTTEHGDLRMYAHYKCRCRQCKDAWNKKTKEYKQKRKLAGLG